MKRSTVFAVLALAACAGCATVDRNVQARRDLGTCRFDIVGIEFVTFRLGEDGGAEVDLKVLLEITNPNESDVVLDHVDANVYFEQSKAAVVKHGSFVRIKGKSSSTETFDMTVPLHPSWITGPRPDTAAVDAVVYVNVLIGEFTLPTSIAVPVRKTVEIPWDMIEKNARAALIQKLFR